LNVKLQWFDQYSNCGVVKLFDPGVLQTFTGLRLTAPGMDGKWLSAEMDGIDPLLDNERLPNQASERASGARPQARRANDCAKGAATCPTKDIASAAVDADVVLLRKPRLDADLHSHR